MKPKMKLFLSHNHILNPLKVHGLGIALVFATIDISIYFC